jgi:glycosyltransferase involved in cell wall biosynthesis
MQVAFASMWTAQRRETGATRRLRRTAELLAARGHDVTVLCVQWWDGEVETFEQNGVDYYAVTDDPTRGLFAARLPFALRRLAPEVIVALATPPAQVRAASVAGRLLRVPVLADWWCDEPGVESRAYDRAARAPDLVVAPSRTIQTTVREHGRDADDIRVVPESIDFSLVRSADPVERADVVYARHLDEHANVESFLLGLAELRRVGWTAAVVGDGPERATAKQVARDLRIDDRVEFVDPLDPAALVSVLKGAHAFVQTATREPFATNLLWALACGCVGVVEYQAASAAHELVEGHDRGFLVTDPDELSTVLVDTAEEDRLQVDDTFAGYDHGAVLDEYLDAFESLQGTRGWF